ncbi:MAG: hypothetical protein V1647_02120 [Pseudomonadota bacterium]
MKTLQKEAIKKLRLFDQKRAEQPFVKTIGKLIHIGLIENNAYKPYAGKVTLEEALWAGQYEPRILELIPSIVLKKPNFFEIKQIPEDLNQIIWDIKKGVAQKDFRGVPYQKYLYWLDKVGHKGKQPSLLKTYRFSTRDVLLLNKIKQYTELPEIEIIRLGLKLMEARAWKS